MLLRLAFFPVWIFALWGSLQLHRLDLDLGHGICGSWGCGPPLEALLGYHGFWLALILPLAICLGWFMHSSVSRKVGWAVIIVGLVGTVGCVGWDAVNYVRKAESMQYLAQRSLFTLVTTVDLPMMQTILAGGLLTFAFGRERPTTVASQQRANVQEKGS